MGGVCGEAELVVDDEVKGPAHSEPWQVGQGQGLCNDALAGECSVSVNLEAQRLRAGREWWGAETLAQSCRTLAQSCRTLAHAIQVTLSGSSLLPLTLPMATGQIA